MTLKALLKRLIAHFPSKLPSTGRAEFNQWADSIFDIYDLPNLPSYKNALATAIMHLPPTCHKVPKKFFATNIRKAMANQIAYEILTEIRLAEKASALEEDKLKALTPLTESLPAACEPG